VADRPNRARHRTARRPSTPLHILAAAAAENIGAVSRRGAVVAASSGFLVSMLASPAGADQGVAGTQGSVPSVDVQALTAQARAVLGSAPAVSVPADAEWKFDVPQITIVKAEVKAEKAPVRTAPSRSVRTAPSRSVARAAAPAFASGNVPQAVAGNAVLEIAARYVGVPYRSGGKTPAGFDCSGFTSYVYGQLGIYLPSISSAQRYAGVEVSRADAKPGDIIWTPGHVGIYAGGNMQIDSPRPGLTIQFRGIWQTNPHFIRVTG